MILPLPILADDAGEIPSYPAFKPLELAAQTSLIEFASRLPLYSDFEFASLWAWNVRGETQVSRIGRCLAFRLSDYLTGEPFYTYCGQDAAGSVADALIERSVAEGLGSTLYLVPEISLPTGAVGKYDLTPSRDDFDYIISMERCLTYAGSALRSRRNQLNGFNRRFPQCAAEPLDLASSSARAEITALYDLWSGRMEDVCPNEEAAFQRFLEASNRLPHMTVGLRVDGRLVAFHISSLPPGPLANGMFEKADRTLPGVYQALMRAVAEALVALGKSHLNYQQDLGLASLRQAKKALDPERYLRKFSLGLRHVD